MNGFGKDLPEKNAEPMPDRFFFPGNAQRLAQEKWGVLGGCNANAKKKGFQPFQSCMPMRDWKGSLHLILLLAPGSCIHLEEVAVLAGGD